MPYLHPTSAQMIKTAQRDNESWAADMARAAIIVPAYASEILFGYLSLYLLSWAGIAVLIAAIFAGPFGAAWLACTLWPAPPSRMKRLAAGAIGGLVVFGVVQFFILNWELQRCQCAVLDKVPWVGQSMIAGAIVLPWLGALFASRWKPPKAALRP